MDLRLLGACVSDPNPNPEQDQEPAGTLEKSWVDFCSPFTFGCLWTHSSSSVYPKSSRNCWRESVPVPTAPPAPVSSIINGEPVSNLWFGSWKLWSVNSHMENRQSRSSKLSLEKEKVPSWNCWSWSWSPSALLRWGLEVPWKRKEAFQGPVPHFLPSAFAAVPRHRNCGNPDRGNSDPKPRGPGP